MAEVTATTQDTSQTTTGTIQPPSTIVPDPVVTAPDPAVRFRGLGTNFKAKLIGIDEVPDSRGDKMCAESLLKLKAAVLASGQHKQKIVVNVSLEGIKIVDIVTGEVQHVHPVHRISFIARDLTDRRAFGYVYGAGEGRHQFFGIKTAKVAEVLVLALRDLFQIVYDMKKKEMEEKSGEAAKVENGETKPQEDVYAVPQKGERPAATAATAMAAQQSAGSLLDLEQQLSNIQEGINNIDSFGPWPQDLPNSPGTPFSPGGEESGSDMFGIASGGSGGQPKSTSSYSDDLFALSTTAVEPASQPGAKLTTNQILAGFGNMGQQQQNMFPGQPGMMAPPGQPSMMAAPGQFGYQQQAAPVFQQNVSVPYGGMFPSGPSPAIPPRPGAMRPPAPQVVPGGAPQNPFGDAAGMGGGAGDMLAPVSQASKEEVEQAKADPFSNLIPGMGGSGAVSKKDMFKNFQMAKPPQPPPRTNPPPNSTNGTRQAASPENKSKASDFDNYFLNSVGGVPLTEDTESAAIQAPVPAPRGGGDSDPFGFGNVSVLSTEDPFASNNAFAQPFEFNQSTNGNSQSLFG